MFGASLYIADHILLMEFLSMAWPYRAVFYTSFGLTGASLLCTSKVKAAAGLPAKYASSAEDWQGYLRAAGNLRCPLWCSELVFMICENTIFTAFVCGMHTGLP